MTRDLYEFSLPGLLEELARGRGDRLAFVDGDVRLTYAQVHDRAKRLASAFAARGLGAGDRVLFLTQNSYRVIEALCAAALLGAMVCPVNWRQSADELAFVIDDFAPKIVFWQEEEIGDAVRSARGIARHSPAFWLQHDDAAVDAYEEFIRDAAPLSAAPPTDADAPALVIYTAAFGGRPNGAMISQRAILTQSLIVQAVQEITPSTVFLNSGPMFHVGTLMTTFAALAAGAVNIIVRRTEAEQLCQLIERHGCTYAFLIPKACEDMARINQDGRYNLKTLQSPPFFPAWDAMVTINPRDLRNGPYGYGQTEVNGLVVWTFYGQPGDAGVSGRASPGTQVRIVNETDEEVGIGEVGEIVVRGPTVMVGYWNRPELNAERQRHGWHHTNDLGRRERDGSLSFIGPKTVMIKSGAENIYPAEVERCLRAHPAIADAAIIGVPDPMFTQSVKAIVQLRPGMQASPTDLIEHCRANLASYKKPRSIDFVEALPRTQIGLVDYKRLDATYGGGNYPGQAWQSTRGA